MDKTTLGNLLHFAIAFAAAKGGMQAIQGNLSLLGGKQIS